MKKPDITYYYVEYGSESLKTRTVDSESVERLVKHKDGTISFIERDAKYSSISEEYSDENHCGYLTEEAALPALIKHLENKLKRVKDTLAVKIHNYKLDLKLLKAGKKMKADIIAKHNKGRKRTEPKEKDLCDWFKLDTMGAV